LNEQERDKLQQELMAYLDGDLSPGEAEALRQRIEASEDFQKEFQWIEAAYADLDALGDALAKAVPTVRLEDDILEAARSRDAQHGAGPAFDRAFAYTEEGITNHPPAPVQSELGRELELLQGMIDDLHAIGRARHQQIPPIDIEAEVMATIRGEDKPNPNVTPLADRRKRKAAWAAGLSMAAAAAIIAVAWTTGLFTTPEPADPPLANRAPRPIEPLPDPPDEPKNIEVAHQSPTPGDGIQDIMRAWPERQAPRQDRNIELAETQPFSLDDLTIEQLLELRLAALHVLTGPEAFEARADLADLSELSDEEALAIAQNPSLTPQARIGAASMLPGEQAVPLIEAIMAETPDAAYPRFELARAVLDSQSDPATAVSPARALSPLEQLQAMDPNNALPHMMEAAARFEMGDIEGAASALETAREIDAAQAYSSEAGMATESALQAAGADPEVAQALAAFDAGADEYQLIFDMGIDLLEAGAQFAAQGNSDSATLFFDSVNQFGESLGVSTFAYEQLAGLDLQRETIEMVRSFSDMFLTDTETVNFWTNQAMSLTEGFDAINRAFQELDNVIATYSEPGSITDLTQEILTQGDISLVY